MSQWFPNVAFPASDNLGPFVANEVGERKKNRFFI